MLRPILVGSSQSPVIATVVVTDNRSGHTRLYHFTDADEVEAFREDVNDCWSNHSAAAAAWSEAASSPEILAADEIPPSTLGAEIPLEEAEQQALWRREAASLTSQLNTSLQSVPAPKGVTYGSVEWDAEAETYGCDVRVKDEEGSLCVVTEHVSMIELYFEKLREVNFWLVGPSGTDASTIRHARI
jgi:hypothetical protein